jgi:hypothetical protein
MKNVGQNRSYGPDVTLIFFPRPEVRLLAILTTQLQDYHISDKHSELNSVFVGLFLG